MGTYVDTSHLSEHLAPFSGPSGDNARFPLRSNLPNISKTPGGITYVILQLYIKRKTPGMGEILNGGHAGYS